MAIDHPGGWARVVHRQTAQTAQTGQAAIPRPSSMLEPYRSDRIALLGPLGTIADRVTACYYLSVVAEREGLGRHPLSKWVRSAQSLPEEVALGGHRRMSATFLVLGLALMIVGGCSLLRGAASYQVELTIEPNPPRSGATTILRARVADQAGAPVRGARVSMRGEHLSMAMGGVTVDAREAEPGVYTTEANLGMSGRWKVTVTADGRDGRVQRDYEIQVVPGR